MWLEWVPTRYKLSEDGDVFFPRRYQYGKLLDIVRMDTRNLGQNEVPRTYLGQQQIEFLENDVFGPNKTDGWRVLLTTQVSSPLSNVSTKAEPRFVGVYAMDDPRIRIPSTTICFDHVVQRAFTCRHISLLRC